ncbi:MAG: DUF3488 domain-containing protein, partial [Phycisphaerales bacterium]|nr:DUF3488 domain-containing protein [Phycisphaerales bacterium]
VLLLVVVIAGIEMLRVGVGVSAFAVFVTLLTVVKLLDIRTPRDEGQVLVLSVAILIAAVLTSNTLMTGVLMVIVIGLIIRAVVLFQLHAVLDFAQSNQSTVIAKARVDIRSMLLATGFLCAIIGTGVFVVLPRNIGMQAFGQWGAGQSISGFADMVELGRPGLISESSTPVLDLTVTDRDGINVGSENSPAVYLRGAVLTQYDNGRWKPSPIMRSPLTNRTNLVPPHTTLKPRGRPDGTVWNHQFNITMRSSSNGQVYLFAPWRTIEFKVGSEPIRLGLDFKRGLFLKDGIGGKIEYAVRSANMEFDELIVQPDDQRDPLLIGDDSPMIEQAISALATRIVRDAGIEPDPAQRPIQDDQAAIRVIEQHLRTQYTYSLDAQPVPAGKDATEWFLIEHKAGHCEYFASSLALMSRSIGIPSRVITGYIVSDFNTVTGQYTVRESNAHAWVEAQVAPGQWRTFDGTPPADFHAIHEPDPSLWRSISKMYEAVEFLWVRTVVGYDSVARQNVMGDSSVDFGLSKLGDVLLGRLAAGRGKLIAKAGIIAAIVFSISLFLGIIALKYKAIGNGIWAGIVNWLGQLRERLVGVRKQSDRLDDPRVGRLERSVRRSLDRLGIPKPKWMPLKAHLHEQLAMNDPVAHQTKDALLEATEFLYEYKFASGSQEVDSAQIARLENLLRKSEKSSTKGQ